MRWSEDESGIGVRARLRGRTRRVRGSALGLVAVLVLAAPALAQQAETVEPVPVPSELSRPIPVEVMVTHLSNREGGVDVPAQRLDEELRDHFRYRSIKVIQKRRVVLKMDEVGSMELPDGRRVLVRPMHQGEDGVLMAVEVERSVKADVRVRSNHLVVIGAEQFEDGKLIISLEPDLDEEE